MGGQVSSKKHGGARANVSTKIVTRKGLMLMMQRSRRPEVRVFQHWVADVIEALMDGEVSITKNGVAKDATWEEIRATNKRLHAHTISACASRKLTSGKSVSYAKVESLKHKAIGGKSAKALAAQMDVSPSNLRDNLNRKHLLALNLATLAHNETLMYEDNLADAQYYSSASKIAKLAVGWAKQKEDLIKAMRKAA